MKIAGTCYSATNKDETQELKDGDIPRWRTSSKVVVEPGSSHLADEAGSNPNLFRLDTLEKTVVQASVVKKRLESQDFVVA